MNRTLTALVLAAPLLLAQSPSVPRPALADLLPAGSYAMVQSAGLARHAEATDAMAIAALVRTFASRLPRETYDEQVGRHLDAAARDVRRELQQVGLVPADVRDVLRRPMVLGVGRLTLRGLGPSLALLVDEGQAAASIDRVVAVLEGMLRQELRTLEVGEITVAGRTLRRLAMPEGPEVLLGRDNGRFVVSNSRGYVAEIFAVADGRRPGLANGSTLAGQRMRLGADPLLSLFVNPAPVLASFAPHVPYEAEELGKALGIDTIAGLWAGAGVEGGMAVETLDVAAPGSAQGLLKAAFAGEADLRAASMCPPETVAFGSLRCDVAAFVAAADRAADMLPPSAAQQARREFTRGLRMALRDSGMTQEQLGELVHALGGSVSFAVGLAKGAMPVPELLAFVPVRDEQVVAAWLDRLGTMASEHGVAWKTRRVDDHEIRYVDVENAPVALSPSFVLANGHLILAAHTKTLVAALRQDAASSLAAAEDFAAAARQAERAAALVHVRSFRLVEVGWRAFETHVLNLVDANADELGFDREAVPDQEAFARGLGTMTWTATVDEQGMHLQARGNLGFSAMAFAGAALLDEVLTRAASQVY